MLSIDVLKQLPFFSGLHGPAIERLARSAKILELENNTLITRQHDRAIALYLLLSGSVQFLIEVEGRGKLMVGVNSEPGLIIGWSVFCAPFRYLTDVRCESTCRVLRIPHHVIDELMVDDSSSAARLLHKATESLADRLQAECVKLLERRDAAVTSPGALPDSIADIDNPWTADQLQSSTAMADFLAHSSLFEGLEPGLLGWLADQAVITTYARDDVLFNQGSVANHLYLLLNGRVGIRFCDTGDNRCVFLRTLENAGAPLGWSVLVDPRRYRNSAFALEQTEVVAIPGDSLSKLCEQQPDVSVILLQRLLQLIGSRLRFARMRLIASRYGTEAKAMRSILDQAAESLPVTSPLHKIPYLLENRLTLADAFHALELTRAHGEPTERDLAELSLEILQDVHRELDLYQGLQKTYEAVVSAPQATPPEEVRRLSMLAFMDVFSKLSYRIQGEENLPQSPGNIFIMNHLENHMETMLPNEFRLTLDSHFVSSMILYKHYGEAPVRVVRKPELGWFGYQQYFDRLDYLYVYSGEVDEEDQDQDLTRETRNRQFLDRARSHLAAGRNLLIAPEGRCSYTEDSPGEFRAGAFRLAAAVQPEPLIVPVAVANFDKRPTQTTTAAIVYPPFRLSDRVSPDGGREALYEFLQQLRLEYQTYVQQAISLASS